MFGKIVVYLILAAGTVSCERFDEGDYPEEAYREPIPQARSKAYPPNPYPPQMAYPASSLNSYAEAQAYADYINAPPQKPSFFKSLQSHVKDLGRVAGHGAKRTIQEAKPALQGVKADFKMVLHKNKKPTPPAVQNPNVPQSGLKDKIAGLLHRKPKVTGSEAYAQAQTY